MKDTRTQTTLRLPTELVEQLRAEAQWKGLSFNELVIVILREWLEER